MAKKKVYAVKKGKQTGLFYSWNECKESVSGYPGAEYKGFETEEEAKNYLENRIQEIKKVDIEENTTNQLVVYVLFLHQEEKLLENQEMEMNRTL